MHATNKPFNIDKRLVYEAYKAVKSNRGAAGGDAQTIEQFEADLSGNLYKIWNRMSSGTYFPPPVRAVAIPKKSGGERILGVPTVADRVAQMVVKMVIEPILDPIFLADSYGYRPKKSALDAVGATRERCWKYDWVLEFDIKGLFDNIDHELLLRAVRKHITCKWALLYIERWLKAPMVQEDGTMIERSRGTPQGGVVCISPLCARPVVRASGQAPSPGRGLQGAIYRRLRAVFPISFGCSSCSGSTCQEAGEIQPNPGTDENQTRRIWPLRASTREQTWP